MSIKIPESLLKLNRVIKLITPCFVSCFFCHSIFSQSYTKAEVSTIIDSASYYKNSNPETALYFLNKIENFKLSGTNKLRFLKTKYSLLDFIGEYDQQLVLIQQYLVNNDSLDLNYIDLLASTHFNLKNYNKQLELYQKGLRLSRGDPKASIKYLNNIGWSYTLLNKTSLALNSYNKGLTLLFQSKQDTLTSVYATLLGNSGLLYTKDKKYKEALRRFTISKNIRKKLNNKGHLAGSYLDIAELYTQQNVLNKGIEYNIKALDIVAPIQGREWMLRGYKNLFQLYEKTESYKKALFYKKRHDSLKDYMFNSKKLKTQSYLKAKIDYEHSLLKLETEKNGLKQKSFSRLLTIVIVSCLLFAVLGIVYVLKRKNVKIKAINLLLNKGNQEKKLLLQEIHHRVKNNLQVISSILELQTLNISDKKAIKIMREGQSRIQSIALVHQQMYQNKDIGTIDFGQYINQLTQHIISVLEHPNKKIEYTISANKILFSADTVVVLGIIINELVTNIYKHAFKNKNQGRFYIQIRTLENGFYQLIISDDGIGLSSNFDIESTNSLGLKLVRILTNQLNGTLNVERENGVTFIINFKNIITSK